MPVYTFQLKRKKKGEKRRLGRKVDRNLAQTLSLTVNQTANSTDIKSQSKLKLQFDQNPGSKLNQVVGPLFYSVDR